MSLDRILTAAAVLVAAVAGAVAVQAQQRSTADSFRANLLAALADHRRHDVAAMFKYPARVIVSGFPIPVQDEAALIRMYDLFVTGADAPRAWNGTVPASGDYGVEVFRRAAYCGAPLNYVLTIAVR